MSTHLAGGVAFGVVRLFLRDGGLKQWGRQVEYSPGVHLVRGGGVGVLPRDGKGGGDEPGLDGGVGVDHVRQLRRAGAGISVRREANEEWMLALRVQMGGASRAGDG